MRHESIEEELYEGLNLYFDAVHGLEKELEKELYGPVGALESAVFYPLANMLYTELYYKVDCCDAGERLTKFIK